MTTRWWHPDLAHFVVEERFQVLHFASFVSLNLISHVRIFGDLSEDSFPACLRVTQSRLAAIPCANVYTIATI